jgi:hypothetical protein
MEPDNFKRQTNGQPSPRPFYPNSQQPRPVNDMAVPRPRPTADFGTRPIRPMQPMSSIPQRPAQNLRQQPNLTPTQPRPANVSQAARPAQAFQPIQQQQTSQFNTDFSPQNSPHKRAREKRQLLKVGKLSFALCVVLVLIVGGLILSSVGQDKAQPAAKAQNNVPAVKPVEQPSFTAYFPNPLPNGLAVAKGSITYYKDSFTFIIEQGGQKSFFVYEQPSSTDPDFSSLKSKLAAPQNISLSVGQGIEGSLDNGTVTAVKTDRNTIIIINCTKIVCSTAPRDIISSMQITSDLSNLRSNN